MDCLVSFCQPVDRIDVPIVRLVEYGFAHLGILVMFAAVWHWSRAPNNIPTKVCHAVIAALACLGFLHTVADFSPGFSRIVNGFFDQPSCRRITGSFDNVKWSFNATGQCNTTAQESAIQGAVAEYIRIAENGTVCEIQCLRLDQGGTWNGWLKLGKVSNFSEDAYCGVGLPFDGCISDGNNDI